MKIPKRQIGMLLYKKDIRRIGLNLMLTVASLIAGQSTVHAATLIYYATDSITSASPDPGGIVGDGAYTTTIPGWESIVDPVLNRSVIGVAADLSNPSDPFFRARGMANFLISGLTDGVYDVSLLFRTVNIVNTPADTARGQSFAVRLTATGDSSLNGIIDGSTGWIIVKPLANDSSKGGHMAPWESLYIAGQTNTDTNVSGAWSTLSSISLSGGSFTINVLDGVGANYSFLFVDSFTFAAVPEPHSLLLLGMALFAIATRRSLFRSQRQLSESL